jgi:hypothetical protein
VKAMVRRIAWLEVECPEGEAREARRLAYEVTYAGVRALIVPMAAENSSR